jgi:hypothetical protein
MSSLAGDSIALRLVPLHPPCPASRTFLKEPLVEAPRAPLVPLDNPPTPLYCLTLHQCIGRGRTSSVWQADINDDAGMSYVAKMTSTREIASIVRETLFYQNVFPHSWLAELVPKYYGTYVSCDGAWYVIILEDAGMPVEDMDNFFSEADKKLVRWDSSTFSPFSLLQMQFVFQGS